jgi:anti-sigma regulatory factor (Ser/Thr protein kinase)
MIAHVPPEHGRAFRHEALLYAGDAEFVAGTAPFIREGVRAGEPVMVVVDDRKIGLLREELDDERDAVGFLDMGEVGQNPARIIPLWRRFVDEHVRPGKGARGIGEPIWPERTPAELTECQRHESLLNVAFDGDVPWSLLCPYDAAALPDDVLEEARRSHPVMSARGRESASELYDAEAVRRPFGGRLPEPYGPVSELRYGAREIADVRSFVRGFARSAGLADEAVDDLVLAVSELATNSVRHATGAGTVRLWIEGETVLCEIRDGGTIDEPLVGRVVPPPDALGGRGIWIVNQLCDLVQVRSSREGTVVRLHMHGA